MGFVNILEECRNSGVDHLVYASSSSVYGANATMPFSTSHNVDHPLNLYAATKKSNELMAHSYSHLYGVPVTGLRFFTVYGPWGRPDMALFKFTKAILAQETIQVFNYGKHKRDFTYIDDIVEGVNRVLDQPAQPDSNWCGFDPSPNTSKVPYRLYNIGNSQPITLMDCIEGLEKAIGIKAKIDLQPPQLGDMLDTHADVSDFVTQFGFKPQISLEQGLRHFVEWYRGYFSG
jgi:UDP-glucuronate 4-epimerase